MDSGAKLKVLRPQSKSQKPHDPRQKTRFLTTGA
jgi:hypothetical protein